MGLFEDLAGLGFQTAKRAAGFDHSAEANASVKIIAEIFMEDRNMLPAEAEAKARGMVNAARQQAKADKTDTIDPQGDRILRRQTDFCQALMKIENVHVTEIRDWWDEPGFMRYVYLMVTNDEWHNAKKAFEEIGLDEKDAIKCAYRIVPVFEMRTPSPGEDPNYTPLPAELWTRARQTDVVPPWIEEDDPVAIVTGDKTPTYNAWFREQVALGAISVPQFNS